MPREKLERKRISIEIPIALHDKVVAKCKPNGLSMTQWVLQVLVKEFESK